MIRLVEQRDAAQIAAIYRPFCEDNCISFETEAPDASEIAIRIEKTTQQYPWLVAERDRLIAGYAYASAHRARSAYQWVAEVTVYTHENFRGKGVGRALYLELLERLRAQGYFQVYAGIVMPNAPSQAFHEAMGFKLFARYPNVGYKLGSWRETGWWQYGLQPVIDNPPKPRPPSTTPAAKQ
jgi:L-amino acid N-acyltransferase YncA